MNSRARFQWLLLAAWLVSAFVAHGQPSPVAGDGALPPALEKGRANARKYCTACHQLPEPDALTKTAWIHHIQPEMAKWLGLERVDFEGMADGRLLEDAGIYPKLPMLSEDDWFSIWDYYRAAAPSQPLPQPAKPPAQPVLKQFRVHKWNPHDAAPMTSLVKVDPAGKRVFMGDAFSGQLFTLDATGETLSRTRLKSAPVSLTVGDAGIYVTQIGRFFPSDQLEGAIDLLPRESPTANTRTLITGLRRPVDAAVAQLNTDNRDDLVICSYGNRLGRLSWFEAREDGTFAEHILLERPGSIQAAVRDFNGDGRLDIIAMTAQAREAIHLFLNLGKNEFQMTTLIEKPPTWGFAGFELIDFNKDGKLDLLVANGDNGDFALPMKPYHGIRLYLNDGKNRFQEAYFHPLHGAFKAQARDFDGDGDLDLAAIAFYPDFASAAPENFIYLENLGGMKFSPATMPENNAGRWMVMDSGDVDGDGDADIVLGSFVRGPTTVPVPTALRDSWRTNGAALVFLENVRK